MVDVWPASLPQRLLLDGYGEAREANEITFKPETGRPKRRRRTSTSDVIFPGQIKITSDQWDALDTFDHATLKDGILSFQWKHPRTEADAIFVFEARPKIAQAITGNIFLVNFSLRLIRIIPPIPLLDFSDALNSQYLGVI